MDKKETRIKLIKVYFDQLNLDEQWEVLKILGLSNGWSKPSKNLHGFDDEGRLYSIPLRELYDAVALTFRRKWAIV